MFTEISNIWRPSTGGLIDTAGSGDKQGKYKPIKAKNGAYYNTLDSMLLSCVDIETIKSYQQSCWKNEEFDGYVMANPSERADSLLKVINESKCPIDILEPLICRTWSRSEHDLDSRNKFIQIFEDFNGCEYFEQTKKCLKGNFIVYRAGDESGCSWTLLRHIAIKYREKYREIEGKERPIISKEINASQAVCFIQNSREEEVIILPQKKPRSYYLIQSGSKRSRHDKS